jgi:hypothetical protein
MGSMGSHYFGQNEEKERIQDGQLSKFVNEFHHLEYGPEKTSYHP